MDTPKTKPVDKLINENCTVVNINNSTSTTTSYALCYNETTNATELSTISYEDKLKSEYKKQEDNVKIGLLFASKAFFQLLANPIVGPLTNR